MTKGYSVVNITSIMVLDFTISFMRKSKKSEGFDTLSHTQSLLLSVGYVENFPAVS